MNYVPMFVNPAKLVPASDLATFRLAQYQRGPCTEYNHHPHHCILISPAELNTIILTLYISQTRNNSATTYCRCIPASLLLLLSSTG